MAALGGGSGAAQIGDGGLTLGGGGVSDGGVLRESLGRAGKGSHKVLVVSGVEI